MLTHALCLFASCYLSFLPSLFSWFFFRIFDFSPQRCNFTPALTPAAGRDKTKCIHATTWSQDHRTVTTKSFLFCLSSLLCSPNSSSWYTDQHAQTPTKPLDIFFFLDFLFSSCSCACAFYSPCRFFYLPFSFVCFFIFISSCCFIFPSHWCYFFLSFVQPRSAQPNP